jgi:hypothetical protein
VTERRQRFRRELRAFAELLAVCGFALAQPLLDVFGRSPEEFVFRGAGQADIVVFGVLVTLALPLGLWAVEAGAGRLRPALRPPLHVGALAAGAALAILQVVKYGTGLRGWPLMVVGAVAGAGFAAAWLRVKPVRWWVGYAAAAPLVFLMFFLAVSPTSKLLTGGETSAAELSGIGNPVPVVVVVFDEFPLTAIMRSDGTIDDELFPHLAALADASHWYRNATAVSNTTGYAVPSILSGRFPRRGTSPIAADHPHNLFTLLGGTYDLSVVESTTRLCPTNLCDPADSPDGLAGLGGLLRDAGRVMRERLSPSDWEADPVAGFVEAPADADVGISRPARFQALLDGLAVAGSAPQLHYLHLLLPHVPYRYLPSGREYAATGNLGTLWPDQPRLAELGRQRLELQVRYLDVLVGQLIDRLRAEGLWDEALLVVTADHGRAFQPGRSIRGLESDTFDPVIAPELMWVPMFVRVPGQEDGTVSDIDALTMDVLPTIADVLDVEVPWAMDGRSLLQSPRPDGPKPFFPARVDATQVEMLARQAVDPETGWARVLAVGVDRAFPGTGDYRLYAVGPRPDLVGKPVAGLDLVPVTVSLEDPDRFSAVDPESDTVPALVRGRLSDVVSGTPTAVAVNGVVGAVVPATADGDGSTLAAMVPEELFREGANKVEVFVLPSG